MKNTRTLQENNTNVEVSNSSVFLRNVDELMKLPIEKYFMFGDDQNDEFTVSLGDKKVGIFKTFAINVLPFMDSDNLPLLTKNIVDILDIIEKQSCNFFEAIQRLDSPEKMEILGCIQERKNRCVDDPSFFEISCEKAILFAKKTDQILFNIFEDIGVKGSPEEQLSTLFTMLNISFKLTAPFYAVEAILDDPSGSEFNPLTTQSKSGVISTNRVHKEFNLDFVAKLLPASLKDRIFESFSEMNRSQIEDVINKISNEDPESMKVLTKVSILSQTPIEQIFFAVHVLSMLPGESNIGDFDKDFAQNQILSSINHINGDDKSKLLQIGRRINAFIRFQNWQTTEKSEENFDGLGWNYATTSNLPNSIIELLEKNHQLVSESFKKNFFDNVLNQIVNIDASSGKGRLLFSLFNQKLFSEKIKIDQDLENNIVEKTKHDLDMSMIKPLGEDISFRSNIGGKGFGLEILNELKKSNILSNKVELPDTLIITSSFFEIVKHFDKKILELIKDIDTLPVDDAIKKGIIVQEKIQESKVGLASNIEKHIEKSVMDKFGSLDGLIVRSSGYFEDSLDGNSQSGIFESLKIKNNDLTQTILDVFSEVFSEKSISFHKLNKLSLNAPFSVVIQKMINNIGGVAFSKDSESNGGIIEISSHPSNISGNSCESVDKYSINGSDIEPLQFQKHLIGENQLNLIKDTLLQLKDILGYDVDMEFVLKDDLVILLQQRKINHSIIGLNEVDAREYLKTIDIKNIEDLDNLDFGIIGSGFCVDLKLNNNIDIQDIIPVIMKQFVKTPGYIRNIIHSEFIPNTSHTAAIFASLGIGLSQNF